MGVPKFYRWLSERYPCLSEVVKEYQIPEFDNLYLDMNGIIHICSHPNDDDPHFRISEEKIFQDIFHYIEFLFRMVQPRKVNIKIWVWKFEMFLKLILKLKQTEQHK